MASSWHRKWCFQAHFSCLEALKFHTGGVNHLLQARREEEHRAANTTHYLLQQ
eukprot:CAMPEP_0197712824 /NCGR_PEP_ID=MMETSP1338-20131121/130151_1 /TAXON_ID=43686 ORGANISM="Pelagodinium beii, Strain RCC1491" /NCGR_SAMPLE_ID=MMETSP1338 /ASSEMBLY_ACC=CAM_ASM_000754 /LENGTH=52 /DNA_ID=CAMNT_0043296761 /DNA_START=764 /DNA_END=922 /DNA_ORIENTATION=+